MERKNLMQSFIAAVAVCLALLSSCQKDSKTIAGFQEVTLEPRFAKDTVSLSDEFSDVEIIPLDNNLECILTDVNKVIATDAGIYVLDVSSSQRVLAFQHDGRFRNNVGSRGHAKGEYQMILNIAATDKGDTVAVIGYPDIMLYDASGRYMTSLPIKNDNGLEDVLLTDRGVYLGYFHRQAKSMMGLYESGSMKHIDDIIETQEDPIGTPLAVDNGHILQEDRDYVYCLDVLNSCIYVCDKDNSKNMAKYSIGLENMLKEKDMRDNPDVEESASRIVSYQAYDGVVRGVIEHSKGYYDFRFSLPDNVVDIIRHKDLSYMFDCCHSGYFYKIVSANTLLDYMNKDKKYMAPIRKLLGKALGDMEGKVSPTDNHYLIKMRLKRN